MAEHGGGIVINISSRTAQLIQPPDEASLGRPRWASITYGPSKAALDRLGAALAYELFEANVSVVTLYPGFTLTERMIADTPPGIDLAQAESAEWVTAALVRICCEPMAFTGKVLGWREVLDSQLQ
jgi:NAD(P)-dependent dehydrogenase (short-subunit alcohol dehydrogenase family)